MLGEHACRGCAPAFLKQQDERVEQHQERLLKERGTELTRRRAAAVLRRGRQDNLFLYGHGLGQT